MKASLPPMAPTRRRALRDALWLVGAFTMCAVGILLLTAAALLGGFR